MTFKYTHSIQTGEPNMSLWKKYSIDRFISFEKPLQFFNSDTASFWESASGLLLYQSEEPDQVHFLSKEKLTNKFTDQDDTQHLIPLQIFSALHKENHVIVFCNYGFIICNLLTNEVSSLSKKDLCTKYQIHPERLFIEIVSYSLKGFLLKHRAGFQVISYDGNFNQKIPVGAYHIDMFTNGLDVAWCEKDGDIVYRRNVTTGKTEVAGQTMLPIKSIQCSDWPTLFVTTKKERVLWSRKFRCELPTHKDTKKKTVKIEDKSLLDSLNSKIYLSRNRAAINIQGIVHNYELKDSGWEVTYFLSDNEKAFDKKPTIKDEEDYHFGDVIGFSHLDMPIRKTCDGSCSEENIEFGTAPTSISNETIFTSTGLILDHKGQDVTQFFNLFDIKKTLPCLDGHLLIFSDKIVFFNIDTEYDIDLSAYNIQFEDILDIYFEGNQLHLLIQNEEDESEDESGENKTNISIDSIGGIKVKPFVRDEVFDCLHVDGWHCTGIFRFDTDTKLICNDYGLVFSN
jgi:hypothetical protein